MIQTALIYQPRFGPLLAEELRRREPGLEVRLAVQPEQVAGLIGEADALLTTSRFPMEALAQARRLRWIQVTAAGVDHFVGSPHLRCGVRLTRLVGTFGPRMAEYAFAYALAISQDVVRVLRQQQARRWESFDQWWLLGRTLLLVGVGTIGRAVGKVGRAFGMRVIGVGRRARPGQAGGIKAVYPRERLNDALAAAHLIVVTVPLTAQTRGMFGPVEFATMRDDAVFINMGRGAVVQQDALVAALQQGRPAWAVLDVFEQEPLPARHPLWGLPNAIVTPHLAGHTQPHETLEAFFENLRRLRARGGSYATP
ncbi:MAG: D-2-hydroxyacid dehydrogenase [Armatimonadota bacterium]|nr:D-2-hydroxyacid dehydrogenase [Armatimonadota bacterium]